MHRGHLSLSAVLFWILLGFADGFCQNAPVRLPATVEMEKSFWSLFSTFTMHRFKFSMQQGKCKAVENHCEKHSDCVAFDRPNVFGKAGCCWYPSGQAVVPDGSPDKKCFLRESQDDQKQTGVGSYFGKIWRQPAFHSTAHLSTEADEGAAMAVMDFCSPFSHCTFRIFNCDGKPLYALEAKMLPSLGNPLELIWSYEIRNSRGDYVGRTSELQSGYQPIELYDANGRNVATLSTVWTFWSAISTGNWYINNQFPAVDLSTTPVLDARLVTFLAAHQFATQGWFGPFWSGIVWFVALLMVLFALKRFRWQWFDRQYEPMLEGDARGMWCSSVPMEEPKQRSCRAC